MNNKKNKIMNTFLLIIIIFLIILIIYLFLTRNNTNQLKPTGNVDIFDITCDYNCNSDTENVFNETDFKENIDVLANNMSWKYSSNLNIFSNPMYEMENKISPESTNFYQFVIRNNTIYNIKYNIIFKEENDYQINMKYRLVKNREYVNGNNDEWVTYENLNLENIPLSTKQSDTYYLEWKWFSSDNDTKIGESDADYTLSIDIKAVES